MKIMTLPFLQLFVEFGFMFYVCRFAICWAPEMPYLIIVSIEVSVASMACFVSLTALSNHA